MAADFPTTVYIMPSFTNTIVGVEPICDTNCTVLFTQQDETVFYPGGKPILTRWREKKIPKLWRFALRPDKELLLHQTTEIKQTTLSDYSAYDLPSVESLVRYMHASSGFPFKSTWIRAIKRGIFETCPGLTYSNAAKYLPRAVETMKGHMVQSSKCVQSTKNKTPPLRSIKRESSRLHQKKRIWRIFHLPSKQKSYIFGINQ